ncbi:unnamed protein product [Bursaphelenchus okinawaensis]|uniref:Uncharacterized protein n=1 Tax=Bursaphelenchus okinawaensis TaxID=465554 RepID=A0A811K5G6_9BILA|nr:unnamed protein product [Bursaphelenchus okinawaensis]CAG9091779.1 unnamed protein product [Bursaphelenchus okinawaensis]
MQFIKAFILLLTILGCALAVPVRQKRQFFSPATMIAQQQARDSLAYGQFLNNQAISNSNFLTMQAQQRQRQDLMNAQMLSNQATMDSQMAVQRAQWNAAAPLMFG